jgi:hypothetical protein
MLCHMAQQHSDHVVTVADLQQYAVSITEFDDVMRHQKSVPAGISTRQRLATEQLPLEPATGEFQWPKDLWHFLRQGPMAPVAQGRQGRQPRVVRSHRGQPSAGVSDDGPCDDGV